MVSRTAKGLSHGSYGTYFGEVKDGKPNGWGRLTLLRWERCFVGTFKVASQMLREL